MPFTRTTVNLLFALGVAGVLDLFTTYAGLSVGLSEANPLAAFFLGEGFAFLVIVKAAALFSVALMAWIMHMGKEPRPRYANTGLAVGVVAWGGAALSNAVQIAGVVA